MLAADALDDPPHGGRVGASSPASRSSRKRLPPAQSGSVGSGSEGAPGTERRGPPGGDGGVADALHRQAHRLVEAEQALGRVRHVLRDVVLAADDGVAQRLDQRAGDAGRHRRDEADPVARQRRREQRHRQDPAPRQAGDRGVPLHHLGVVQDVGPADVEGPVHRRAAGRRSRRGSAGRRGRRSAGCGCAPSAGVTITGSRSVRYRSISNDAEPEPRTTPRAARRWAPRSRAGSRPPRCASAGAGRAPRPAGASAAEVDRGDRRPAALAAAAITRAVRRSVSSNSGPPPSEWIR